ncbi:hypothetical protein PENSTE_c017G00673 [Penicillium steckii]|uniref:Zn(2)-C6 fungal-type domain-containing protein n=1 Tax=Penicillium steckii TaxID=303698 RepID=A0A1V6SY46_9EURO|nr:hypothetical protein PENSTE_c017G00673 [Penicillium steckii]
MGGKPFKSKGCISCRKRKVKCDQQKPHCAECQKRKLVCQGYDRDDGLFIHHDQKSSNSHRGSQNLPGTTPGRSRSIQYTQPQVQVQSGALCRGSERLQIFSSYYDLYFPKNSKVSQVDFWQFLISGFAALPKKSMMLEKAICAVSSFYIGKMIGDTRLFNYGLQMYTEAMRILRRNIQLGFFGNEMIYTAVIFQEIEKIHRPRHLQAYFAHVEGTKMILDYCRPMIVKNSLTDAIYTNHSRMSMYLATTGATSLYDEYKSVAISGHRTLLEKFIEIYDTSNRIVAAVDIATQSSPDTKTYESLLSQSMELEKKWNEWFSKSGINDHCSYADPEQIFTSSLPSTDALFGRAYRFESLDSANFYIWHSAMMIRTLKLIHKVRTQLMPASVLESASQADLHKKDDPLDTLRNEYHRKLEIYADRACLCIPFCAQDDMRAFGVHAVLVPMCVVVETYIDLCQREKFFWCQRFYQIGVDRCNNTATHMSEVGWNLFRKKGLA